jgi:hypothetical protein
MQPHTAGLLAYVIQKTVKAIMQILIEDYPAL